LQAQPEDSAQINNFYRWIRAYLADLSRADGGELSHAINFGYWPDSCANLFQAQMALFELICSLLASLNENDHGVEVGCGIGGYAMRLLRKYPVKLTCYDLLQEHLNLTRQYAKDHGVDDRLETIRGNSMHMDTFADNALDFMYCVESSFHYHEKQKFFDEVCRVLKPGATFAYADISCENTEKIAFKSGNHFSAKAELDAYITNAGLSIIEHQDIGPHVYEPLYKYTEYFNDELLDAPTGSDKAKVGKYWDLVNSNYTKLYRQGLMGYQVYKIRKS
jgi:MPBQ/MSBQ methyltransferase